MGGSSGKPLQVVKGPIDVQKFMGEWCVHVLSFLAECALAKTGLFIGDAADARCSNRFRPLSDPNPSPCCLLRHSYPILELDEDYSYTVIGFPSRAYVWIMAREPKMDEQLYEDICARLREQHGYDLEGLVKVPHQAAVTCEDSLWCESTVRKEGKAGEELRRTPCSKVHPCEAKRQSDKATKRQSDQATKRQSDQAKGGCFSVFSSRIARQAPSLGDSKQPSLITFHTLPASAPVPPSRSPGGRVLRVVTGRDDAYVTLLGAIYTAEPGERDESSDVHVVREAREQGDHAHVTQAEDGGDHVRHIQNALVGVLLSDAVPKEGQTLRGTELDGCDPFGMRSPPGQAIGGRHCRW
eukprot:scaffold8065_cov267-Pinguiococcus_pyrenoidosus.AAC.8